MSRLTQYLEEDKEASKEFIEHDDNIKSIIPDLNAERQKMVVVFDADYLVYFALYAKDKDGNVVEWTIDRIEELQTKLSEMFLGTLNKVEKYWDIQALYTFIRGKNNFRKDLCKIYKSKRPEKHPLTDILYNWLEVAHQAIPSHNAETDDYCASVCSKCEGNCIVISCDKDLLQLSTIIYNPQKDYWRKVSPKEAKFNLYKQFVIGDSSDSVTGCQGCGEVYFNKNFHIDMTDKEYEEALYKAFEKSAIKTLKGTSYTEEELTFEALKQLELTKKLITLRTDL